MVNYQTPKPSKPDPIHPLTPTQTHEPSSLPLSSPLRRRSLRLSATPDSTANNSTASQADQREKTFLNLRSGKKVLKRTMPDESEQVHNSNNLDLPENTADVAVSADPAATPARVSAGNRKRNSHSTGSEHDGFINLRTGKKVLKRAIANDSEEQGSDNSNANEDDSADKIDNAIAYTVASRVRTRSRNSGAGDRGSGHRRNNHMDRFHEIARENAARFAHFLPEEDADDRSAPIPEPAREEIEDWPGPFSTAMKIIRDRGTKLQNAATSSQAKLCESIAWVPKMKKGNVGVSVPSLQDMCLDILAKNVDAIASLDSVPDALRHRLSQLLCDSRRINGHFLELLVRGTPTEIRLRDCSWLTEERFTECFRMCDTRNLVVLQLDQCGRCLPDYVIVVTLAQSPRHLSRLTTLSLSGACRLSDGGLRAIVSSAPALRSINLSQCSLLTSASIYILVESLRSLLKELYLDDCQGLDAALIVPALIELEHLEVLSVAGLQTVCDEFVKNYTVARGQNMKELVLKDCTNLTDASIKVIVEHCPGLCVLDLVNLSKLTDLSVGYLTNGCRTLHTLKLCRNPFSDEAIAAFVETTGGSLKELSLNNIKKVGYHTTISLANHAKNLYSLDLSWCRNLTDNALGLIVDSCLALRLLKLFGCSQVTDAFVNGHSNQQIQIIGLKMSPVLQHVKVPNPHQGALNYSSVSVDMV